MPKTLKMTHRKIEKGKSTDGGWSREQLHLLGVEWPPVKGWKNDLVGHYVDPNAYSKFLLLKNKHLKKEKPSTIKLAQNKKYGGNWVVTEGYTDNIKSYGKDPEKAMKEARTKGIVLPVCFYVPKPGECWV